MAIYDHDAARLLTAKGQISGLLSAAVTYYPAAGGSLSRRALVEPLELEPTQFDFGNVNVQRALVHMIRDTTLGVTTVTVDVDEIAIPIESAGGSTSRMRVTKIVGSDPVWWRLMVTQ